jgi:hypothetical protein
MEAHAERLVEALLPLVSYRPAATVRRAALHCLALLVKHVEYRHLHSYAAQVRAPHLNCVGPRKVAARFLNLALKVFLAMINSQLNSNFVTDCVNPKIRKRHRMYSSCTACTAPESTLLFRRYVLKPHMFWVSFLFWCVEFSVILEQCSFLSCWMFRNIFQ